MPRPLRAGDQMVMAQLVGLVAAAGDAEIELHSHCSGSGPIGIRSVWFLQP
jgi:hypothetical protein